MSDQGEYYNNQEGLTAPEHLSPEGRLIANSQ